ncbi:MAG: M67 family metallopeptidase [Hydrogenobaculum sp.]
MLKIKKELLEKIKSQAEKDYPYETCGIMIGKEEDGIRVVYELLAVENANKERKNDRYEINPKDYMKAERYADEKGLQIVGIYHSHPDHPDMASKTDEERAFEYLSYIIVSVQKGKAVSFRSFELLNKKMVEEKVIVEA